MSQLLTLPRLGETMDSGRVVGWLKEPGQTFRRGETIVEIESDKTVVELPALADGRLLEVMAPEGAIVAVGEPLCRYNSGDGATPPISDVLPPEPPAAAPSASQTEAVSQPLMGNGAGLRATPLARRLARQHGIDLAVLRGTGRRGRVEARDVRAAALPSTPDQDDIVVRRWQVQVSQRATAVLLHGFGGDAQTWAPLAAHLVRQGIGAVAPDLPGHGATRLEAADIDELAAPLSRLLDGAAVELIGHSMGGAVAVALARAHPDRIARLTLIAPAGLDDAIDADFVRGMAGVRSPGGLAHLLRRLSSRPPLLSADQLAQMAEALAGGRLAALANALVAEGRQQIDIVADLEALPMPVRVVWGLEDRIIPWTQVARLPAHVAVHLVAGAGHMPHWDAPQRVAALFSG